MVLNLWFSHRNRIFLKISAGCVEDKMSNTFKTTLEDKTRNKIILHLNLNILLSKQKIGYIFLLHIHIRIHR